MNLILEIVEKKFFHEYYNVNKIGYNLFKR